MLRKYIRQTAKTTEQVCVAAIPFDDDMEDEHPDM